MDARMLGVAAAALMLLGLPASAGDKIGLKVLYAGNPDSHRKEQFAAFLTQHFAVVGTIDFRRFKDDEAKGYDVVVFDWTAVNARGRGSTPAQGGSLSTPALHLSSDFDRPAIFIGAAGGEIASKLRLKIDEYCQCLQDAAHGMVLSHEIFREPLPVDLRFEERPTPANYREWPGGEQLGPTIRVWKVQTRRFPEVNPGPISDPYGFGDSPDAEAISSGLNGKGPSSVALGRHGNFFLWGFSAPPPLLTSDARKCLINSICYIKKFDGQKPIVRRVAQGREWSLYYAGLLKMNPTGDSLLQAFPAELRRRFGRDSGKYLAYYRENLEYLHPTAGILTVDEDVKGLGLSNRRVELLDRCVAMLENGERPEPALRILYRYTNERFVDAKPWRAWLEDSRGRLFFTDVGGYKFLVAPAPMAGRARGPFGSLGDRAVRGLR